MSGVRSQLILVGTVVLASPACSSSLNPFIDDVSYRPPTATIVSSPDCLAQSIYTGLTGSGPWDPALTSDAPDPGYPPATFQPVAVVRCERGTDEAGGMTVDSVRLEGNIHAVDAAFSADSKRFPDGVVASCVYAMDPPVGLWFVNEAGKAFRPAWPASPCGLQNAPMEALADLNEVSRSPHPTGIDNRYNTSCESSPYGQGFDNTTPEDVAAAEERERSQDGPVVPSLVMPIDDVDQLQLCTVRTSNPLAAEELPPDSIVSAAGTSTTLGRAESASIVRSVANAPLAPACNEISTRIASTELRRPDGSGRSFVSFELDGCQRAAGFGYYRAIPTEALSALTGIG
ncbi:hypothetical protein [Rhodococcus sp. IEGM 1330]|uniref:hypothetical protein n=1 Tax=Rhodococcus sp. IEGM 1330 TaxID=3082225 RepID=UPI00295504C7|nr:hypothetical protein [Rhodococcus sp. IEGM 1330]MDV8023822.1 hypothetical protein [Rhodococcus sp. IEGM 1330]